VIESTKIEFTGAIAGKLAACLDLPVGTYPGSKDDLNG
jgi:hypothetical protein